MAEGNGDGKETFGMLYFADIKSFESELHSEIEKKGILELRNDRTDSG